MATKQFPVSWVGTYRATSNRFQSTNGKTIHAGGEYRDNTYLGIPSSVKNAIKTSKTKAKLSFKMRVTNAGEFDFGGHKETYNKAGGTMPWYKYLGLHPIYSSGWRTTDLTSSFMNDYVRGYYHGIVIYGGSNKAEAYGKTGDSNQAVFVVEGAWNTAPKAPSSVTNPKSSTIADRTIKVQWRAGSDSESSASKLKYRISYYNGSKWAETWTVGTGTLSYDYPTSDKPETSRARFRVQTIDPEGVNSGWTYSPYFTVNHNKAPSKPTRLSPTGGKVIDRTRTLQVTWKNNDDGTQAGYNLAWRTINEDGSQGAWNYLPARYERYNSTSQYHEFAPNTFPLGEIEWTVKTQDQQGEESPYATYERFYAGEASSAPIWLTPQSGDVLNTSEVIASWSSLDQVQYEIELREGSTVLWSDSSQASNKSTLVDYALENDKNYSLRLRIVIESSGLWSDWSSVNFSTQFIPPIKPTIEVVTADEDGTSLDNVVISWVNEREIVMPVFADWTIQGDGVTITGDYSISIDATSTVRSGINKYFTLDELGLKEGDTVRLSSTVTNSNGRLYIFDGVTATTETANEAGLMSIYHTISQGATSFQVWANTESTTGGIETAHMEVDLFHATETVTDYVQVYRREYNITIEQPWGLLGDNQAPNSSFVDYSPASELTYEYMVRAWGVNNTYTESDIIEGEVNLSRSFLQRAYELSDLLVIDAEEREETYDFGGELMMFANREKPVFEHGINELKDLPLSFYIDSVSELRNTMAFIKRRETFLYRDNVGRRFFCAIRNPEIKDKEVNGFEMSLTLSEVDYTEGT